MADQTPDMAVEAGEDVYATYVSQRKKRGLPKPKMQPMMTPMIDVTFQLLLFFILTMQFRRPEGQIPADLPSAEGPRSAAVAPLVPLTIYLRPAAGGGEGVDIEISRHNVVIQSWQGLYEALRQLRGQFGDEVPVVIRPAQRVNWGDTLNAFRQAQRANFKNVALPSQAEKS